MITIYTKKTRYYVKPVDQNVYSRLVRLGVPEEIAIDADSWAELAADGETYYCDEDENVILYCS